VFTQGKVVEIGTFENGFVYLETFLFRRLYHMNVCKTTIQDFTYIDFPKNGKVFVQNITFLMFYQNLIKKSDARGNWPHIAFNVF
jgi:hypothetical protein